MKKNYRSKSPKITALSAFVMIGVITCAMALCTSCKAWRTISTTSTYEVKKDTVANKSTTTITTKTVEEYQGIKKN